MTTPYTIREVGRRWHVGHVTAHGWCKESDHATRELAERRCELLNKESESC